MKLLRNDFMKWHMAFVIPYIFTYILGRLRGTSTLAYKLHPYFGAATVLLPLLVFILSKNKRLIKQMIKSNFNMKCKPAMKIARISTIVIGVYFVFSVTTGSMMNYGVYGTVAIYKIISKIHTLATYLVPIVVATHVGARIWIKKAKKRR